MGRTRHQPEVVCSLFGFGTNNEILVGKTHGYSHDHLIHQAFLEDQPREGDSYVPFRSGNQMPCYCEALPDKDRNRVYVLFHLTPPPNPDQLDLFEI